MFRFCCDVNLLCYPLHHYQSDPAKSHVKQSMLPLSWSDLSKVHAFSHLLSFVQERGALRSCSSWPAINCSWSGCIIVFPGASNNCGIGRIVEAVPCSSCYATGAISTTSCLLSLHMEKNKRRLGVPGATGPLEQTPYRSLRSFACLAVRGWVETWGGRD